MKTIDINVKMYRVVDDAAFLVKVEYMDKYAEEHTGLMLVDSCCNDNILSSVMEQSLGLLSRREGETTEILTLCNEIVTNDNINFSFVLGGEMFHEVFCVNNNDTLPQYVWDMPIIGVIGNSFMKKYRLAMDYSDFSLHTSSINPEKLKISDCDYFFPMEIGFKYYNCPVVSMKLNGKEIVALADTGATNNIIVSQTVSGSSASALYLGIKDTIHGHCNSVEADDAIIPFELVTVVESGVKEKSYKDLFKVVVPYIYGRDDVDDDGNPLPPVEAAIGSQFMARESWILDFGVEIIYKKKVG